MQTNIILGSILEKEGLNEERLEPRIIMKQS